MAASAATRRRLEAFGVEAIDPARGLSLLAQMLSGGFPAQIGVFPVNWSKYGTQLHHGVPALLEYLVTAAPAPARAAARELLDSVLRAEPEQALRHFVRGALA